MANYIALCEYKCKRRSNSKQHLADIHDIDVERVSCDMCKYTYKGRNNLKQHLADIHDINVEWMTTYLSEETCSGMLYPMYWVTERRRRGRAATHWSASRITRSHGSVQWFFLRGGVDLCDNNKEKVNTWTIKSSSMWVRRCAKLFMQTQRSRKPAKKLVNVR